MKINILLVLLLIGETVRDEKIRNIRLLRELVPGPDSGGDDLALFIDLDGIVWRADEVC